MTEERARTDRWREAREVLRAAEGEAELLGADPDLLTTYAGQWIAVRGGKVIAHHHDGAELAKIANANNCPGVIARYVPTLEEQAGVFILAASSRD